MCTVRNHDVAAVLLQPAAALQAPGQRAGVPFFMLAGKPALAGRGQAWRLGKRASCPGGAQPCPQPTLARLVDLPTPLTPTNVMM